MSWILFFRWPSLKNDVELIGSRTARGFGYKGLLGMRYFDKQGCRLIYVGQAPTSDFWDSKWHVGTHAREQVIRTKSTYVSRITKKYIQPQEGFIIEGGCGTGKHVAALASNGYRCIGVDSAEQTVCELQRVVPELDIRLGDVRHLEFRDAYFFGYWSTGVIEHFWDGYQDVGLEIARVIKPGGCLFLTFPYMSPLRRLKARLGRYPIWQGDDVPDRFYQFALDHCRVACDFRNWGFELVRACPLDGLKGTKDEIALVKPWLQALYDYRGSSLFVKGFRFILSSALALVAGHSMLLVLRRRRAESS